MTRSTLTLVAAGALAATVVVWSAAASDVELWHEPPAGEPSPREVEDEPEQFEAEPEIEEMPEEPEEPADGPDLSWLLPVLLAVAAAVALALILRNVRFGPRRPKADGKAIVPLPEIDLADVVDDVADDLHERLARGSPRNAIVECWVILEDAVADAGRGRRPAETSAEFTARVIGEHSVDATAIDRLAALYREARFSRHELGEHHRDAAVAALESLREQLRGRVDEPVAPATPA